MEPKRTNRPHLTALALCAVTMMAIATYTAWMVGGAEETTRPIVFFSYWPPFWGLLSLVVAFAVGFSWSGK